MENKKFPTICPSCGGTLQAQRFQCPSCATAVEGAFNLPLLARLSPEDQRLAISLIKASGSLKAVASQYGVSYPTVRNRLDELIVRINNLENEPQSGGQEA